MGNLLDIVSEANHGQSYEVHSHVLFYAQQHNIKIVSPYNTIRNDSCLKEGFMQIGSREVFHGFDNDDHGGLILKTRLQEKKIPSSFYAKDKNIIALMIHENKIYGFVEELTSSKLYKTISCRNGYSVF
jgi:hypothetical protein